MGVLKYAVTFLLNFRFFRGWGDRLSFFTKTGQNNAEMATGRGQSILLCRKGVQVNFTVCGLVKLKGATSRLVHLEKISLNFSSWSFSILNHPRSFLVYYFFGVFYLTQLIFVFSFKLKVILHVAKNYLKYRDVAPLRGS